MSGKWGDMRDVYAAAAKGTPGWIQPDEVGPPKVSTRYRVRQMTSGRTSGVKFNVHALPREGKPGGRVNVHAHHTRESAQADADDLNIGDMVRPHDVDPRPYAVRRAEAERIYREAMSR